MGKQPSTTEKPKLATLRTTLDRISKTEGSRISFARAIGRKRAAWDVAIYLPEHPQGPSRSSSNAALRLEIRRAVVEALGPKVDQVIVLNGAPPQLCSRALTGSRILPTRFGSGVCRDYWRMVWRTVRSPSPLRRWVLLAPAVLVTVILAAWTLDLWLASAAVENGDKAPAEGIFPSSQVTRGGLRAQAAVERNDLFVDDRTFIWLTLENVGSEAIQRVRIAEFQAEGLTKVGECWSPEVPICLADSLFRPVARHQPRVLQAHERITLWAELQARGGGYAGGRRPMATLSWTGSGDTAETEFLQLAFPRLTVHEARGTSLRSAGKAVREFLKDFALPLAVVFVGFWFERARKRQDLWHQMLERVHENAQRHYMPICSAITGFGTEWERAFDGKSAADDPSEETRNKLFYHFVMIFARLRKLRDEIGGYYFKNRDGEDLAFLAVYLFRQRAWKPARGTELKKDLEALASRVDPAETLDRFMARGEVAPSSPADYWLFDLAGRQQQLNQARDAREQAVIFGKAERGFEVWLSNHAKEDVCLLHLIKIIFEYEMNVPYEPWYGQRENFDVQRFRALLRQLTYRQDTDPADLFEALIDNAQTYIYARA